MAVGSNFTFVGIKAKTEVMDSPDVCAMRIALVRNPTPTDNDMHTFNATTRLCLSQTAALGKFVHKHAVVSSVVRAPTEEKAKEILTLNATAMGALAQMMPATSQEPEPSTSSGK